MASEESFTCGRKENARCVFFDPTGFTLPAWSSFTSEPCLTTEETTQDLYAQLDKITTNFDLDNITSTCLTYTYADTNNKKISEVVKTLEDEICSLRTDLTNLGQTSLCELSISSCNITTSCLDDACMTGLSTVGDLLQAMINKMCELETRINNATGFPIA